MWKVEIWNGKISSPFFRFKYAQNEKSDILLVWCHTPLNLSKPAFLPARKEKRGKEEKRWWKVCFCCFWLWWAWCLLQVWSILCLLWFLFIHANKRKIILRLTLTHHGIYYIWLLIFVGLFSWSIFINQKKICVARIHAAFTTI